MQAKILIVEDEAITAMDLENTLKNFGFNVISTASTGEEAIQKTEELKPDLILMDISLKGQIDGIEAANRIMTLFDIPVIYLTAYSDKKDLERAKLTQPYGIIIKPFSPDALVGAIEIALYKHELDTKIKENEAKYQLLYEDAPLPYQSLDESGHIVEVNEAWLDTLGYSKDEVIGKWFGDLLTTNNAEKFIEYFPKFKAKGEICNIQFEMKHKNGSTIIAEFNGKINYDKQGNFQRTHCIFQDITKQVEIERKLNESKTRYKQFFNNPLMGFALCKIITDKNDNPVNFIYLKVNKAFEGFTGLKREEVLNKNVTDVLPYDDVAEIIQIYGKVALTGESTIFEYPIPSLGKYYEISAFSPKNKYFIAIFTDITMRKKAEEALSESEKRMNKTQEIAHIGSWELDLKNNHLFWSDEVYRIFGLQPQEFGATYEAFLEAIHPEDRELVDEAYSGSLREGMDTYEIEHRVVRKSNGEIRFVHEKCEHFKDESGQIIKSVGMVHDITDHRKMEEELKSKHDLLQAIIDSIPVMITIYDPHVENIQVNKAFEEITGWNNEEVQKMNIMEAVYPDSNYRQEVFDFMQSLSGWKDITMTIKDGSKIESSWANVKIPDGRQVGIGLDIRERKKLEYELRQASDRLEEKVEERTAEIEEAEEKLKESEERFDLAVKAAQEGIWDWNMETDEVWYSHRYKEMLGYSDNEIENHVNTWLRLLHPDDKKRSLQLVDAVLRGERDYVVEFRLQHKDGHYLDILSRGFPVRRESDGKIVRIVGTHLDLTELKKAEKMLKKTINELKRSNEELQSFAYITSHDLQEPLRTMGNYAGLLKYRYKGRLDGDADEFLEFIAGGAARMKDMVQGLLDYSRVGREEKFDKFNAKDALNIALANLKSSIDECHAEVIYDSFPDIVADKSQITRVFQNLIGNALKFRKEGVLLKIHITVRKECDEYVFSVSDNGIGLEEQYCDRIFEVFKRLHTIDKYQGAGIGLAIVKRIIDRHAGRVWVESGLGKGSTFYFTIPVN